MSHQHRTLLPCLCSNCSNLGFKFSLHLELPIIQGWHLMIPGTISPVENTTITQIKTIPSLGFYSFISTVYKENQILISPACFSRQKDQSIRSCCSQHLLHFHYNPHLQHSRWNSTFSRFLLPASLNEGLVRLSSYFMLSEQKSPKIISCSDSIRLPWGACTDG